MRFSFVCTFEALFADSQIEQEYDSEHTLAELKLFKPITNDKMTSQTVIDEQIIFLIVGNSH